MSDDEIRKAVLWYLRGNSPSSTRAVRDAITARASRVDEALRALLTEHRVIWTGEAWHALRHDGTRYGHATNRDHRPSGAQLSYLKALRVLAAHFESEGMHPPYAREKARVVLRPALPDKQRARLEASA